MRTDAYETPRLIVLFMVVLIVFMAFTVSLLIAFFPAIFREGADLHPLNMLLFIVAFGIYLFIAFSTVLELLAQFTTQFYDLSREDAQALSFYLFTGLPLEPPKRPLLRIQEGHTLPDGPLVMYMDKVGGPGYFSIAHDSAVVTGRLGKLRHVLGPGFYRAEPFEKVWDVIDLRPQRRSLRTEFMTTDGIPAYCDVEIRFQVGGPSPDFYYPHEENVPPQPFRFNPAIILRLATSKYVKSREGTGRVQDWRIGLVNGALDGILRDTLERYSLDHFFNPRYWALQNEKTIDKASPSPERPIPLLEIQARVEETVRQVAAERGIVIDTVQLGPVLPDEEAISRQWLEFWQAKAQHSVDILYRIPGEEQRRDTVERASIAAQVEFVGKMLSALQELNKQGSSIPEHLIIISFMDVLRTMSDQDPGVQLLMYQQAESLVRIINAIQKNNPPFGPTTPSVAASPGPQPPSPTSPSPDSQ